MFKLLKKIGSPKKTKTLISGISAIRDISILDNRQLSLSIISSILSDLIYLDCDKIFDTDVLLSLGLVIRFCHISSTTKTKMMAFSKASPEELTELDNIHYQNKMKLTEIGDENRNYNELLTENYKYDDNITALNHQKNIKRIIKYNELTEDFIAPYYSPKFNDIISSLFKFDTSLMEYITHEDLFIVFRGTITGNDLYTDLQFPMVSSNITPINMKLHKGFLKAYNSIVADLDNLLNIYQEKSNIIFTGHSLGAALASIAIIDYTDKLKNHPNRDYYNAGLITFGSPRITDEAGSNYFTRLLLESRAYNIRFCNQYDPVVYFKMPSGSVNRKYKHLVSVFTVNDKNKEATSIVFNLDKQNIKTDIIARYKSRYKSGVNSSTSKFIATLTSNIITHFMGNYIINLIQHLPPRLTRDIKISIGLQALTN